MRLFSLPHREAVAVSLPEEGHEVTDLNIGHGLEDGIGHERIGQDVNVHDIRLLEVKPSCIGIKGIRFCRFRRNHPKNYSLIGEFELEVAVILIDLPVRIEDMRKEVVEICHLRGVQGGTGEPPFAVHRVATPTTLREDEVTMGDVGPFEVILLEKKQEVRKELSITFFCQDPCLL